MQVGVNKRIYILHSFNCYELQESEWNTRPNKRAERLALTNGVCARYKMAKTSGTSYI
jgi:hypothetical protein